MSYQPTDPYTRGPAQLPQLVGQRVEAATEYGQLYGWTVHVVPKDPMNKDQPDGLVVAQEPPVGTALQPGSVLLVEVVRRIPFGDKYGRGLLTGIAAALALLALVLGVMLVSASSDDEGETIGTGTAVELAAANDRIAELEAQVEAAAGTDGELVASLQAQLAGTTTRAASAEATLAEVQAKLDETAAQVEPLAVERDALVAERDALLQQVADLQAEVEGITAAVVATPDFVGAQQVAVEEFVRINSIELVVQTVDEIDDTGGDPVEPGAVVSQVPAPGVALVRGAALVVTVYRPAP